MTVAVDPNTLGGRIRAARDRAGVSQEQLAAAVATTQSTVSKWEGGDTRYLTVADLTLIAEALRVHPAELLPGTPSGYLVVYVDPDGLAGVWMDRVRAEEVARNTASVVLAAPVIADYRQPREDTTK